MKKTMLSTWLLDEKAKITNVSDIPAWVVDNQQKIMLAHNMTHPASRFYPTDRLIDLKFDNLRFEECSSNTHRCPENGITNFFCSADLPSGYPGWRGQIKGQLAREKRHIWSYPFNDCLHMLGIKTGSGGGGNSCMNYEFTAFIDDWPSLKNECDVLEAIKAQEKFDRDQERIVKRLKGVRFA